MKIRIPAGAAVLHAASNITGQKIVTREGALLSFQVDDLDLADTLGALKAVDDEVAAAMLVTDNGAELAGLTDLRRALETFETDIRRHFQFLAALQGQKGPEPVVAVTGSQPTATGGDAISNVSTQLSDTTQTEETTSEPSQPEAAGERPRRRAAGR